MSRTLYFVTNLTFFFFRKQISDIEQRVEKMARDITILSKAPKSEDVYLKVAT